MKHEVPVSLTICVKYVKGNFLFGLIEQRDLKLEQKKTIALGLLRKKKMGRFLFSVYACVVFFFRMGDVNQMPLSFW